MTDWVEKYHQHKQTAQKGGPGSGHHGHAGRPGQRGGSLPGKASGAPRSGTAPASVELKADRRAAEFLAQGLPEKNSLGNIIRDKEGNPRWSGESRPRIKAEVVDALAQKAGLSKEQVNDIVGEWSETSSDESRKALEMQVAAARVFGTEASFRLKQTFGTLGLLGEEGTGLTWAEQDGFIKAMYEHTQGQLAKFGFKPGDSITLYRGLRIPKDQIGFKEGDKIEIGQNPLSSWSSAPLEASKFASGWTEKKAGIFIKMEVPVSSILATARTGFGCLPECEWIVLGGEGVTHSARVLGIYSSYEDMMKIPTTHLK